MPPSGSILCSRTVRRAFHHPIPMQSPEQEEEDGGGVEESPAEGEEPWCAAAAEGWAAL